MADTKPTILGGTAIKPKERHGWEAVRYIIHNPETGEFFTRTPKSWALITGFYIIYYSCLAGFWLAMLNIFFLTLEEKAPKWKGANGLIGDSPGLGLKPAQLNELIDSSMIAFNKDKKEAQGKPHDANYVAGWEGWANRTRDFLKPYVDCTGAHCFPKSEIGTECSTYPYGYDKGKPCVYLKLNKIFDLKNTAYTVAELDDPKLLPSMTPPMPETLKAHIKAAADKDQVWVECHGEYPADKEGLGTIDYFPKAQGFPAKYFPYMGKTEPPYQSPLIAVQFANAKHNQLLHIECRAWAKNIGYSKRDRIGINHMELLILDTDSAAVVGQS